MYKKRNIRNNSIPLFFSFLCIVSFCFLSDSMTPELNFPKLYPDYRKIPKKTSRIFLNMISMPGDNRQRYSYTMWMYEFNHFTNNIASFSCAPGEEIPDVLYLHPSEEEYKIINITKAGRIDRDRAMKRYLGAKYFYENTDFEWYWTATDDLYLDMERLPLLIDYLDKNYDPLNENVLKAHIIFHHKLYYPQGGVGFILSRKAVKKFLEIGKEYISRIVFFDDLYFYTLGDYLNVSVNEVAWPFFFGNMERVRPEKVSRIRKCTKEIPKYSVYNDSYSVKNLVAFHSLYDTYEPIRKLYKLSRSKFGNNLYFQLYNYTMKLCTK